MMVAMLETCPRGEEKTNLFPCIFLQRLPREIRVLLSRVDHKDPKELAKHRTSCGRYTTPTAAAAASPLSSRTAWRETSLPPGGQQAARRQRL
jgi:hypothetical protein